jgi:hypothetical protein
MAPLRERAPRQVSLMSLDEGDLEGRMINCEHFRPHIRPPLAQAGGQAEIIRQRSKKCVAFEAIPVLT